MRDEPRRQEERPGGGARLITENLPPKDSTDRDLEKLVLSFAAVTEPGDTAAAFLPDGSIYLLERTADGVYSEPGDEDSAARFLVAGGAA